MMMMMTMMISIYSCSNAFMKISYQLSLKDRKHSLDLYSLLGVQSVADVERRGRLRWFEQMERKSGDDWIRMNLSFLFWQTLEEEINYILIDFQSLCCYGHLLLLNLNILLVPGKSLTNMAEKIATIGLQDKCKVMMIGKKVSDTYLYKNIPEYILLFHLFNLSIWLNCILLIIFFL